MEDLEGTQEKLITEYQNYQVVRGDTLSRIAQEYNTSYEYLEKINSKNSLKSASKMPKKRE